MKKSTLLFLLFVSLQLVHIAAQSRREHCVMFYNVENLFHPSDDTTHAGDDDFTPEGVRRWNFYRYNRKIAAICKVILAVNGWEPPDAVCISEIENMHVLNDIVFHPLMLGQQYRVLHRDSPDHRGIDVGILYREDRMECLDSSWIEIRRPGDETIPTREILAATFQLSSTGDTMVICANHWTSKYGGAVETEANRLLQARVLGTYVDQLLQPQALERQIFSMPREKAQGCREGAASDPQPAVINEKPERKPIHGISVIAGGDLNDLSGSTPVQMLSDIYHLEEILPGAVSPGEKFPGRSLSGRNTSLRRSSGGGLSDRKTPGGKAPRERASAVVPYQGGPGSQNGLNKPSLLQSTYKYQGNWGSIDHVFVGGKLRAEDCRASVFRHPLLIEEDIKYTGEKPYRTYNGFSYHGGISDHLPLLLHFVVPRDREQDRMKDQ